jgi:hypothetical protein
LSLAIFDAADQHEHELVPGIAERCLRVAIRRAAETPDVDPVEDAPGLVRRPHEVGLRAGQDDDAAGQAFDPRALARHALVLDCLADVPDHRYAEQARGDRHVLGERHGGIDVHQVDLLAADQGLDIADHAQPEQALAPDFDHAEAFALEPVGEFARLAEQEDRGIAILRQAGAEFDQADRRTHPVGVMGSEQDLARRHGAQSVTLSAASSSRNWIS